MRDTPTEGLDMLLALLAGKVAEEFLKGPNGYLTTEIPPFHEELYDHPKAIVRHPDGSIAILLKWELRRSRTPVQLGP